MSNTCDKLFDQQTNELAESLIHDSSFSTRSHKKYFIAGYCTLLIGIISVITLLSNEASPPQRVNTSPDGIFFISAAYPPPTYWGKQNYIDYMWSCFAKSDKAAMASGSWKTGVWNPAVNQCWTEQYCPPGQQILDTDLELWGKQDYIDYVWNNCFYRGDYISKLRSSWSNWNPTVNQCFQDLCIEYSSATGRILQEVDAFSLARGNKLKEKDNIVLLVNKDTDYSCLTDKMQNFIIDAMVSIQQQYLPHYNVDIFKWDLLPNIGTKKTYIKLWDLYVTPHIPAKPTSTKALTTVSINLPLKCSAFDKTYYEEQMKNTLYHEAFHLVQFAYINMLQYYKLSYLDSTSSSTYNYKSRYPNRWFYESQAVWAEVYYTQTSVQSYFKSDIDLPYQIFLEYQSCHLLFLLNEAARIKLRPGIRPPKNEDSLTQRAILKLYADKKNKGDNNIYINQILDQYIKSSSITEFHNLPQFMVYAASQLFTGKRSSSFDLINKSVDKETGKAIIFNPKAMCMMTLNESKKEIVTLKAGQINCYSIDNQYATKIKVNLNQVNTLTNSPVAYYYDGTSFTYYDIPKDGSVVGIKTPRYGQSILIVSGSAFFDSDATYTMIIN